VVACTAWCLQGWCAGVLPSVWPAGTFRPARVCSQQQLQAAGRDSRQCHIGELLTACWPTKLSTWWYAYFLLLLGLQYDFVQHTHTSSNHATPSIHKTYECQCIRYTFSTRLYETYSCCRHISQVLVLRVDLHGHGSKALQCSTRGCRS